MTLIGKVLWGRKLNTSLLYDTVFVPRKIEDYVEDIIEGKAKEVNIRAYAFDYLANYSADHWEGYKIDVLYLYNYSIKSFKPCGKKFTVIKRKEVPDWYTYGYFFDRDINKTRIKTEALNKVIEFAKKLEGLLQNSQILIKINGKDFKKIMAREESLEIENRIYKTLGFQFR